MKKFNATILVGCCFLVLTGAGCIQKNAPVEEDVPLVPELTEAQKDYILNKRWERYEELEQDEVQGFENFVNSEYGISFRYPDNWVLSTSETGNFLDVKISNASCSPVCPPEFIGMEFQAGLIKNSFDNFDTYIKNKVSVLKSTGQPSGKLTKMTLAGQPAYMVENSGWGGISGPGYFVYQGDYYYTYIYTGSNDLTAGANNIVKEILASLKISENKLPPVEVVIPSRKKDAESPVGSSSGGVVVEETINEYRNEDFKFVAKYPEDCAFKDHGGSDSDKILIRKMVALCKINSSEGIRIMVYEDNLDDTVWYFSENRMILEKKRVFVAGKVGELYYMEDENEVKERWVFVERDQYTFVIVLDKDQKPYGDYFMQIAGDFSFI